MKYYERLTWLMRKKQNIILLREGVLFVEKTLTTD
jgi:hypothetical protein